MAKVPILLFLFFACVLNDYGQQEHHYNLAQLLNENKLDTTSKTETRPLTDSMYKQAISTKGLVYLKEVTFLKGTIEVDIRGKNVFLQSYLASHSMVRILQPMTPFIFVRSTSGTRIL